MIRVLTAALLTLVALPAVAQDALEDFLWQARPIVLFADNANDPRLIQQLEFFAEAERDLAERDVVVIVDTEEGSDLRRQFRPRDFQFVLVGKDGEIKYRRPDPVPVRELVRLIDRIPLRRQEMGRS